MDATVTVIVVNWNTCELLRRCLASVEETAANVPAVAVETIVVDNDSSDDSVAMVRVAFPQVRLIANERNIGFACANNQAIAASRADWVLLLNSDAELSAPALEKMLGCARQTSRAAVVGCKLINPDGSFQSASNSFPNVMTTIVEAWGLMGVVTGNPYYPSAPPWRADTAGPCDWVGGACFLVRRTAMEAVGLLDETFFMYAEELDWCYRMWRQGWQVWYAADAAVVHVGGGSADRRTAQQRMRLYEGKVHFIQKHYGDWAAFTVRLAFRSGSLTKALGYRLGFLVTRRPELSVKAASHWPVVWTKAWV